MINAEHIPSKTPRVVYIGSRHVARHVIRIDTERGVFEEMNCKLSEDDIKWQRLLLHKGRPPALWSNKLMFAAGLFIIAVALYQFIRSA